MSTELSTDLARIYVEYLLGAIVDQEVIDWAVRATGIEESLTELPPFLELAALDASKRDDRDRLPGLLQEVVSSLRPDFVLTSAEGLALARITTRRMAAAYLRGELRPYKICQIVTPLEMEFDRPGWLGKLFDACDWVEPSTEPTQVPHLAVELRALLARLDGLEQ